MAAGPRRESGPSLEDIRRKTSITTGVIVTNRVVKYSPLAAGVPLCAAAAASPAEER